VKDALSFFNVAAHQGNIPHIAVQEPNTAAPSEED
jgi:hypothetical protein